MITEEAIRPCDPFLAGGPTNEADVLAARALDYAADSDESAAYEHAAWRMLDWIDERVAASFDGTGAVRYAGRGWDR
jgi:hypothetical protein